MVYTLTIPNEYGYVILAAATTLLMNSVHGSNTGKYRKLAKVPYPNCYATAEAAAADPNAYLFNSAQRAHANFTENHISTLLPLLLAGLRFPIASAILGVAWTFNRYLFMIGYCDVKKTKGSGRYLGAGQYISTIGLFGMVLYSAVQMIRGL